MAGTSGVVASALELSRLVSGERADAGLRLLRLDLAPVAAAILSDLLGGQVRRRPVAELHELIDEDLTALREAGLDLPQRAQAYCDQWRRAGILLRASAPGSREETYELSAPAEAALRYLTQVERPRATVTQSRLATISNQLRRLVRDSDPSPAGRLAALRAERDALDKEIARVEAGDYIPLEADQGAERLEEIIALAEQVPGDFARVRAEMTGLNRSLRERIAAKSGSRGEVLDDVFRGVDRIESSEAGRSFLGFHELLADPESSARLDDEIDTILDRDFSSRLSPEDRRFLRHWRSTLMEESGSVRQTMTGFSRSLRRFVQSRAFEEHHRLAIELAQAQRLASRVAASTPPQHRMTKELNLTGVPLTSIGSWRPHNPAEVVVEEDIVRHDVMGLDLEAVRVIVRASEIDMVELEAAVDASVARRGVATVAQVLEDSPATQGLASVIGLLLLARRRGQATDGVEHVTWTSRAGRQRAASVPRLLFTSEDGGTA